MTCCLKAVVCVKRLSGISVAAVGEKYLYVYLCVCVSKYERSLSFFFLSAVSASPSWIVPSRSLIRNDNAL